MIYLNQNSTEYNNDIRAMIMAFYPGVKIVEDMEKVPVDEQVFFSFVAEFSEELSRFSIKNDVVSDQGMFVDVEAVGNGDVAGNVEAEENVTAGVEVKNATDELNVKKDVEDEGKNNGSNLFEIVEGSYLDKAVFRNKLKRAIYHLLCKQTGRVLPWGDLTGVRPTKIAMSKLQEGKSYEEAVKNYEAEYETSHRKAVLATQVAKTELELTTGLDLDNEYCLYVGIPFCPSRCLYCSFTSYPIATYQKQAITYIDKLCEELDYIADKYKNKNLRAIYIGGGTPTSIDHILLDKLLSKIESAFSLRTADEIGQNWEAEQVVAKHKSKSLLEFTVEAGRPDSITVDKLRVMKAHGVTRISINPQTMNNETLRTIGRAHTAEQAKEAFAMAREMGFDNINMDLIAGLPGENLDSMRYTLEQIEALHPESLTVHSLAIKRAANLKQQMDEYGDSINQDMNAMHELAADMAEKLGMKPYYLYRQKNIGGNLENVGYSKPGTECLYNILIMEEMMDIVAAGAGASTKLVFHTKATEDEPASYRVERIENCKSVDDYINRFDEMIGRKQDI